MSLPSNLAQTFFKICVKYVIALLLSPKFDYGKCMVMESQLEHFIFKKEMLNVGQWLNMKLGLLQLIPYSVALISHVTCVINNGLHFPNDVEQRVIAFKPELYSPAISRSTL